jgi:hypothetical protein
MNWRHTHPSVPASRALGLILLSAGFLTLCSLANDLFGR